MTIQWAEPSSDGGCDITSYLIEYREAIRRSWNRAGTVDAGSKLRFTVTPLTEGQQYLFRVAAENSVGLGDFAELTQSVTAKSQNEVPGAPLAPEVSDVMAESCYLSWKAPAQDGGSPILGYFIERCTGTSSRWLRISRGLITDTSSKVTDLVENNEYTFRVVAENKVGAGPAGPNSETILATDPWGKPSKPGIPEITAVDKTRVTLQWKPPKMDGGSEIFNYVLEYRVEGAFRWKKATHDNIRGTTYIVKGLEPDTVYEFRVAAENKAGLGPFSETTMPVKAEERVCEYMCISSNIA